MGCSESRIESNVIKSIESNSQPKPIEPRPIIHQQSDRIVEDCIVIWLINDSSSNIDIEKEKLCRVVSTVKVFTNRDECITYITKIQVEKIFFIVPSIESYLDSIQNLPQMEKIYVFNSSIAENANNQYIVTSSNTFSNIDNLCKQLEIDVELCELDLIVLTTTTPPLQDATTTDIIKKQEALFLYAQLKREILYRLKFENNAKNDFISFCRLYYTNNPEQTRMIDNFETNYRPQRALIWLTRPCFIRRILQRMQRTFEIDILYKLGFIVKHAHTQLTIFQENNTFTTENLLIVYRGKTMFSEKFNSLVKNKCGGLLSFTNFFTGYIEKQGELNFIQRRLTALPNAVGIIFEIHVNQNISSPRSPFASLDKVYGDDNIDKNGILFGMSTVLRIDSIEQFTNESQMNIWAVKLTLISDDDQQLLRLVAPLRSSEVHANPLSYIGKLFMDMGEYTQAEQFFLGMLQDASVRSQPRRLVRVHIGLGSNYMQKGDYAKALEQYQQALTVSLSYLPPTHTDLATLYDAIGKSYFRLNEYQKAVENYERAADLLGMGVTSATSPIVSDLNTRIDSTKKLLHNNKQ